MFYSLDDLRNGVRFKSDQYQTQRIQNDELDGYINDGIDQGQALVFPLNENYFVRESLEDLVSGTQSYTQPDDAKALIGIDVSYDSGLTYNILTEKNIDRRNSESSSYSPYSFYFEGTDIVLLGDVTQDSTDGIKWVYIWEHWDLSDSTNFQSAVLSATRASNIISIETAAAHNVSAKQLITLDGMVDSTFDGTFRVISVPTATTLTCGQKEQPDDAGAGNTGTLYRRYGMDLPGGRTMRRYVEAWATRQVLMRDDKDTIAISEDISYLATRLRANLNYRNRGKTKKIRKMNTYNGSLYNPYGWSY